MLIKFFYIFAGVIIDYTINKYTAKKRLVVVKYIIKLVKDIATCRFAIYR